MPAAYRIRYLAIDNRCLRCRAGKLGSLYGSTVDDGDQSPVRHARGTKNPYDADGAVDVPCFSKGLDDRLDTVRSVRGPVDIVLFEGWRIGVAHPNFYP